MEGFSKIRTIAIALILCSLGLPLSRCERTSISLKGDTIITTVTNSESVEYNYKYAKDWFILTEWEGWLALLTFSWPLIAVIARWRSNRIRESQVAHLIEILLCVGSGFMIWGLSSAGERLSGAYVAFLGMALYLIVAVRDAILLLDRNKSKETEQQL